jgi:nucleoid-associated protein YgaU
VGATESVGKSTATDGPRQYTVERGDTLSYLALRHYGDPFKWEKIYEANKETMKNPNYIYVGQRIVIPS